MVYQDVVYSSAAACCRLDVTVPDGVADPPLYIYFHGGGLESGDKGSENIRAMSEAFSARGIAVASVNYRMYPRAAYPDYLTDAAEAVAYLQQHAADFGGFSYYCVGGSSAGGYITTMLFFNKRYFAEAGVDTASIQGYVFDAGQPTAHFNHVKYDLHRDPRCVIVDESSAFYYMNEDFAPEQPRVLITCAEHDMPGRAEQVNALYASMLAFRFPSDRLKLKQYAGYSHCGYYSNKDAAYYNDVAALILE